MIRFLSLFILGAISLTSSFQTKVMAAEGSVYDFSWLDQDKEIYVLQNRKFRKKNNVYVGGTIGRSVSGAFIDSNEINLLGGFFFSEDWGLELSYTKAEGQTNKTHDAIQAQQSVAFFRKIDTSMSAMLMWAPFYSKINTFNKIFYYDWMFGAGIISAQTLDNRNNFKGKADADFNTLTNETVNGLTWLTTLRFYINQNWSTRIDFKAVHLNVDTPISEETDTEKRFNNYYNFNIGLNYAF